MENSHHRCNAIKIWHREGVCRWEGLEKYAELIVLLTAIH